MIQSRNCLSFEIFVLVISAFTFSGRVQRLGAQERVDNLVANVLVGETPRQIFAGFGTSLGNWNGDYQKLPPKVRDELSESMWKDLKFRILRLWMNNYEFRPNPGASNLSRFRGCYVDSGLIADAKKYGATTLLLAPDGLPEYMQDKQVDGAIVLKAGQEAGYAKLIADFIAQLKKETGITLDATGVQNEPNELDRFTAQQIVDVVKQLRIELDSRGLANVKIIASEQSSGDDIMDQHVDALKNDPAAWKSLTGIASHSYNMAARDSIAQRIAGPGGENTKEYWMTEASDNGPEEQGDARRAAGLASRFLSDMNHRVTHWIHFLGFEVSDPRDNATRIIAFDPEPLSIKRLTKYDYYRQLSHAFDVGASFRKSTSSLDGEMTYTFGLKPRLTVAAAKNPDGSWAIGLSNYTADAFDDVVNWGDAKWNRVQGGHTPAQTISATIDIPELANSQDTVFEVYRSTAHGDQPAKKLTMQGGKISLEIAPLELVTLRSQVKT